MHWTVTLRSGGSGLKVRSAFVADGPDGACEEYEEVLNEVSGEPAALDGLYTASRSGVFWLCLDNVAAFWHSRTCAVSLKSTP